MMTKEGLVDTFVSVFAEHHENKAFKKQMETTFGRISREKIPEYFEIPEDRVPSLQEFASRTVVSQKVLVIVIHAYLYSDMPHRPKHEGIFPLGGPGSLHRSS